MELKKERKILYDHSVIVAPGISSLNNLVIVIASLGHVMAQTPHPMHFSGFTSATSSTLIALNIHRERHVSQPVQASVSIVET